MPSAAKPERGGARVHVAYLARVLRVYAHRRSGPLSFWYEHPELNERAFAGGDDYFMCFAGKARYAGPFDAAGIPLLDYHGQIGVQYNPIAIAQYGLARFNAWSAGGSEPDRTAWVAAADWLVRESRSNAHGVSVWMHDFDWPYREVLHAPWYSGLAQGNGLSLLVRAACVTGATAYAEAAHLAFVPLTLAVADGGVLVRDDEGDVWIEEYMVQKPSHVLNGFIWALLGVHDYARWSGRPQAHELWRACIRTLERRLHEFDTGWWSLYEAPNDGFEMLASAYYHALHITQLRVLHRLTGLETFAASALRFQAYANSRSHRLQAFARKSIFKLRHY